MAGMDESGRSQIKNFLEELMKRSSVDVSLPPSPLAVAIRFVTLEDLSASVDEGFDFAARAMFLSS
jgi:hypothetical protein